MGKVDKISELFHNIFGHITVVRSALELVKMKAKEQSESGLELVEESEERLKLLVKDLDELREIIKE